MAVVVYSCITKNYDEPADVTAFRAPHIMFTDSQETADEAAARGWEPRVLPPRRLLSRWVKHHPMRLLDCDVSVWIDGAVQPFVDLSRFAETLRCPVAAYSHPLVTLLAGEAMLICERKLPCAQQCVRQYAEYIRRGFVDDGNNRHCETGVLVRKHSQKLAIFQSAWWDEVNNWSERDQMSFAYVAWLYRVPRQILRPGHIHSGDPNRCLFLRPHRDQ